MILSDRLPIGVLARLLSARLRAACLLFAPLHRAEYKGAEVTYAEDAGGIQSREIYDRHGVRLVFTVTGNIGHFDKQTLLIQLVTSMGLFAGATVLVDKTAQCDAPLAIPPSLPPSIHPFIYSLPPPAPVLLTVRCCCYCCCCCCRCCRY